MKVPTCPGGCNACRGGEVNPRADYPAAKQPWRCKLFRCSKCKAFKPWCNGAADDMPKACDDCWAQAHQEAA